MTGVALVRSDRVFFRQKKPPVWKNGEMEEDVNPKDEDGVDGRGVGGWDGWVCGLGAVGASSIFGLRSVSFTT